MAIIANERASYGDLVVTQSAISGNSGVDYNFGVVPVSRATDNTADVMGLVVLWDNTEASFRAFNDANNTVATTTRSGLPNGAELAVIISDNATAKGHNAADVTLGTTDTNLLAMFRGEGEIKLSGLVFEGTTSAANIAVARRGLEVAGISVIDDSAAATPQYFG